MALCVAGLGTALPPCSISQINASELARTFVAGGPERSRGVPLLYRRSGVQKRHSVLLEPASGEVAARQQFYPPAGLNGESGPGTAERMRRYAAEAPGLAIAAARAALTGAGLEPRALTHLITVSCSGFSAPGFDLGLIEGMSLSAGIARTHVGFMGCHGALNGLRVARAFVDSDPRARVLLTAVELCSLHLQYGSESDTLVANALFADGAAALVAVPAEEAPEGTWRLRDTGSIVIPRSADAMTWNIGDHGFEMTLSPRVPDLIQQHLRGWLGEWLARSELALSDIRSWAVHPGGPRILTAVEEALELPPAALAASREVLAEYGNMSSPTVLFILERLRLQNAPRPCLALGFGPGLVAEAALFV